MENIQPIQKITKWMMIFLLLAGCNSTTLLHTNTPPQHQPQLTVTLTTVSESILNPTYTDAESPLTPRTFTPTSIPSTLTPLPTLSPEDAQELVLDLLKNNSDCSLPCWWGITPGETNRNIAKQFLATFAFQIGQGESGEITENGVTYQTSNYTVCYKLAGEPNPVCSIYSLRNGVVDWISTPSKGNEMSFTLSQFLTDYGPPEEIRIRTFSDSLGGRLPFLLTLFYPELGIRATYSDQYAKNESSMVIGCFTGGASFSLWSPKEQINWNDYNSGQFRYKTLDKGTDMDIDTFYETFIDPDNNPCLGTPANLWPLP
jgi:hypothetical protein